MYINCLELFKDDNKNKLKFVILLVERGTLLEMGENGVGRRKKYLLVMQGKTTGSFTNRDRQGLSRCLAGCISSHSEL